MSKKGILVLNAGSSSIKFSLYVSTDGEEPRLTCSGQVEGIGTHPHFVAKDPTGETIEESIWQEGAGIRHAKVLSFLIPWLVEHLDGAELIGAGHRVVHGGTRYAAPVRVTPEILADLETLIPLAPLHQPHNLATIQAVAEVHPELPQVACFDTAFHRTNPETAQTFALPRAFKEEGVRRYGFHGLSYEYIATALPRMAPDLPTDAKVIVAHLGSGASMCALQDGKSVASTMGFTALDGLVMGTRPGNIDPGVVLYLMQSKGLEAKAIETLLYKESGLKGLSGISNDMRDLLRSTDPAAREAIEVFVYRIGREIGSLAAALGGVDALVFTAGIGERSAPVRAMVCEKAAWLGLSLDAAANEGHGPRISTQDSRVSAWVIPTNEELRIAHHTRAVLERLDTTAA